MSNHYKARTWSVGGVVTAFSIDYAKVDKGVYEEQLVLFRVPHPSMEEEIARQAQDYLDYMNKMHRAKQEAIKNMTISSAVAERMSK